MRPPGEGALDRGAVTHAQENWAGLRRSRSRGRAGHRRPVRDGPSGGVRDRGRMVVRGRRLLAVSVLAGRRGVRLPRASPSTSRYDDSDAKLTKSEPERRRPACGCSPHAPSRARSRRTRRSTRTSRSRTATRTRATTRASRSGTSAIRSNPTLVNQIVCPGSQNDVTINDGILITSTDSRRTNDSCNSSGGRLDAEPAIRPTSGRA